MSTLKSDNLLPAYLKAAQEFLNNPDQLKAFESTGNCVVLAGPGSGKTKLLTTKMAKIIQEDIRPPQGITCITYSTECARELHKRLDQLGIVEKPNIYIGTVHGFCLNHIIRLYAKIAGYPIPYPIQVADTDTRNSMFANACRKVGIQDPPYFIKTTFDRYRRTYLDRNSPEFQKNSAQMPALIGCYENDLHKAGYIDFDDMAIIGLDLVKNYKWIQTALKSRFPVFVVDEYQDLGVPLHQIVLHMVFGAKTRIVAVGDPDQSIYGFTGAQPHLLRELAENDSVEKVELGFNYRSAKKIVANSVIALGEKRNFQSTSKEEGEFYFWECPDGIEQQTEVICSEIIPSALAKKAINGEQSRVLGDVAVLYLDKNDAARITTTVKKHGYKYIGGDREASYRQTPVIRWLEDCAAWCSGGWRNGKPRLSLIINFWLNMQRGTENKLDDKIMRQNLVSYLWGNRDPQKNLKKWLEDFVSLGLLENLEQTKTRTDEIESLMHLLEVANDPEKMGRYNIQAFGHLRGSPDHLNLITLHSSKGLEFDVVIMMGLEQGRIPNYQVDTEDQLREERRKFYVGLTRAKREVHLVFSGWYSNNRGRRFASGPSEFVLEQQRKYFENEKV